MAGVQVTIGARCWMTAAPACAVVGDTVVMTAHPCGPPGIVGSLPAAVELAPDAVIELIETTLKAGDDRLVAVLLQPLLPLLAQALANVVAITEALGFV